MFLQINLNHLYKLYIRLTYMSVCMETIKQIFHFIYIWVPLFMYIMTTIKI